MNEQLITANKKLIELMENKISGVLKKYMSEELIKKLLSKRKR